ncbi:MAG: 16S rRNA (cytosine(1402)-N(4))-methyltransferase RsmH [Synergistaceae bacterium]|jgi:16S rRNA (cytosine1402-N4)-methyltransferase|nr:16S rRNA (cytosine(1402)-N(4))-methyltransferase RsmH [Synergistaceae bacterium]
MTPEHEPVMPEQVIALLTENGAGGPGSVIVDCTLGLGGYSERILRAFPDARVRALDRDRAAVALAEARLAEYGSRFEARHANFGDMETALTETGWTEIRTEVDEKTRFGAFVFDLGVSNMQLTEAERGFSFQNDGPLDMRMDPGTGRTAAEVLETLSAQDMAEVFWLYGEERHSRRIAERIEENRRKGLSVRTTGDLTALIRGVLPAPVQRKMGTHPARRVFQALRIYVNDELNELEAGLASARRLSEPGTLVIAVSYHSLEDRIVKHTFRAWEREEREGFVLTGHPLLPSAEEIEKNFKARSAKLRAFRFAAKGSARRSRKESERKK